MEVRKLVSVNENDAPNGELPSHSWTYDPVVKDFGPYGVRYRKCERCGTSEVSDAFTGAWPVEMAPSYASQMTGSHNVLIGHHAGQSLITGSNNTFIGDHAGFAVTTADGLVILGDDIPDLKAVRELGMPNVLVIGSPGNEVVIGRHLFGQPSPIYARLASFSVNRFH